MLAIIPARGGSRGIPGKNIKTLCGKPLIAHTIESAQASTLISRLVLSTDDQEIANIARNYGVEIPFMRPEYLAKSDSQAIDNYIYTIERLNKNADQKHNEFIVLQPTSPLRTASDIDDAIKLFFAKSADSVISMNEAPHPPMWAKKIDPSGQLVNYFDIDISDQNRQAYDTAYIPNGAIYIFRFQLLKAYHTYYFNKTYAYVMPSERSVDIDTILDFEFAEFLLTRKLKEN